MIPVEGQKVTALLDFVTGLTRGKSYEILAVDDKSLHFIDNETHTVAVINDYGFKVKYYWPSQLF